MAQARDVMKEVNREEFREKRRAEFVERKQAERTAARIEREKARPATKVEQIIIAADKKAKRNHFKFADALRKEGIALARASAVDVEALKVLRQQQDVALMTATAEPSDEAPRRHIFADVREGEIVIVTSFGDVVAINQQHMAALEYRNFPAPGGISTATDLVVAGDQKSDLKLASIAELHSTFEIDNDLLKFYWQTIRAAYADDRENATARRVAIFESGQAVAERRAILDSVQDAKQGVIAAGMAAVDTGTHATSVVLSALATAAEGVVNFLGNIFASPSKPTELEREVAPRVRAEADQVRADALHRQDAAAEYDFRLAMQIGVTGRFV